VSRNLRRSHCHSPHDRQQEHPPQRSPNEVTRGHANQDCKKVFDHVRISGGPPLARLQSGPPICLDVRPSAEETFTQPDGNQNSDSDDHKPHQRIE